MKTATPTGYVAQFLKEGSSARTSAATLAAAIEQGLPIHELKKLMSSLGISPEKASLLLGISTATLHRRTKMGRLAPSESDRLIRFARLAAMAAQVMGSPEAGKNWLRTPQYGLGGKIPLEFAGTEIGAREVENLLGRIEHGVYS
jgi:putative toxin-antitoxin system antitoxin component (TIGR02293 family)